MAAIGFTLLSAIPIVLGGILLIWSLASGDLQFGVPWEPRIKAIVWALPIYFLAGPAGGVVFGLLWEWTRWWVGRRIVAILATLPGTFLISALIIFGFRGWGLKEMAVCVFAATVWGGVMSFIPEKDLREYWRLARGRSKAETS